ncbi:MAG: S49 family peptidase, partial [Muribaculaceae bacterium]|nr:S49 family peptidase [Muribaculaceae bacterium]
MSSSDKKTTGVGKHSVLVFDMSGEICEIKGTPSVSDVMSGNVTDRRSLGQITAAIYRAAHDSRIEGIYVECNGAVAGIASFQAIDEALRYFASRPDKWIVSYADSYTQGNYYAVSGSTELWLNPLGAVDVHGLSATTMFYTGLLDKLGVKMQVLRVGTFKSAVEPYILKDMSPASRMQQEVYMNSIWNAVKDRIAENRKVTPAQVDGWADDLLFTMSADSAKALGAVSAIGYRHQAEKHIAEMVDKEKFADVKTISINDYISAVDLTDYSYLPEVATARHDSNVIAVLYAEGEISDNGKSGIIGNDMVSEIENLIEDSDRLAGLILRVNSPGGSAFASE